MARGNKTKEWIKTQEDFKQVALEVANEPVQDRFGKSIPRVVSILRKLATHERANINLSFLELAYGKPEEKDETKAKSEANVHVYLPVQDKLPLDD